MKVSIPSMLAIVSIDEGELPIELLQLWAQEKELQYKLNQKRMEIWNAQDKLIELTHVVERKGSTLIKRNDINKTIVLSKPGTNGTFNVHWYDGRKRGIITKNSQLSLTTWRAWLGMLPH